MPTDPPAPDRLQPRPGILEIAPYVPGESKATGQARPMKLSSNEGAFGPSPKAIEAYLAQARDLHRYPDGGSTALRAALSRRFGFDESRLVIGAGSDELIALLMRAYVGPGDEVLYSQYGFLMYPIAAHGVGATPVRIPERDLLADVDAILAAVTPRTRAVFLANPNNPTGTYLPPGEVRRLARGLPPTVLLVLDAAYAEYVERNDYTAGDELVAADGNVVMLRTFSKIYALGGMRIGWAYCPVAIADVLNRLRGPFNVALPSQSAGVAALEDEEFVIHCRRHNEQWRNWLAEQLAALGLTVTPSVTNFLLVHFHDDPKHADAAFDHLSRDSIIVRKMTAYGLANALRITIGTEPEVRAVAASLARFVG